MFPRLPGKTNPGLAAARCDASDLESTPGTDLISGRQRRWRWWGPCRPIKAATCFTHCFHLLSGQKPTCGWQGNYTPQPSGSIGSFSGSKTIFHLLSVFFSHVWCAPAPVNGCRGAIGRSPGGLADGYGLLARRDFFDPWALAVSG